MTFLVKLKELKKNIKPASVDTYSRNIRRLRKVHHDLPIPASNAKWLSEEKLFDWFDKQPLKIRRHLAVAATVAANVYGKKLEKWTKRQHESMKEFDKNRRSRTLTDKQKQLMPVKGFDSLKHVTTNLKKELKHIMNNVASIKDLLRFQDLIIISLYYELPLRLDYASLKIGDANENCIYKNQKKPRGWHIRLQDFKTSKTMGQKIFKLKTTNQRLLNRFIPAVKKYTEHGYLLTNKNGQKMSRQVLSKTLMRITQKYVGKRFSTQLLRILYAMKSRDVIESAKEVSEKLLHSFEQSLQYAKKD